MGISRLNSPKDAESDWRSNNELKGCLAPTTTVLLVVYIPPSLRAEAHRIEPILAAAIADETSGLYRSIGTVNGGKPMLGGEANNALPQV
jgi:hypothetical protein